MVGLSEKAKGKQRAIDPVDGDASHSASTESSPRTITVRFADGSSDISVEVEGKDSVRTLKHKIREGRPDVGRRRLRLIYGGRILTEKTNITEWLKSVDNRQKRDIEFAKEKGREGETSVASIGDSPIWLHCSVGAEMAAGEEEEEGNQKGQIKPLRGFDRLAAAGFSEEDIAQFRRTFHSRNDSGYTDPDEDDGDENDEEHARDLEEQWIDSLDDTNNSSLSQASAPTTMLQGLIVGFFFPLLPFFFLRDSRPAVFWENGTPTERQPNVIFSKRMQMALVLGFMVNVIFGTWRYLLGG